MLQRILGIVGWIATALVIAAVAIRFLRPEWDQYAVYMAWAGLAGVVLYTLGQWRDIVAFFRGRQARYGALATVSVIVALAIAVAVNYLANRQNKRWDLTANQQNSLSEQTVKLLQGLEAPVKFTVFDQQTNMERFRPRMAEYTYNSNQVTVDYVDVDTQPGLAREYDITTYGTIVVEYMGRRERATSDMEQDITNALIKAISGMERKVYFVEGHGEKDPTDMERDGYSAVSEALRRDNYAVEKLVLAQQKEVPEDATVVVLAGPTSDLLPQEKDALQRYLERQGKLLVLLDPPIGAQAAPMPNIISLLNYWGFALGTNVVVDISGATNDPSIAVAASYPQHAITDQFATLTLYPLTRSVDPIEPATEGRVAVPIVQTSPRSWAEVNLNTLSSGPGVEMQAESGDKPGPITVAGAMALAAQSPAASPAPPPGDNAPKPETRVVVFGDSDFASNAYGGIGGNPNMFANAVSWLAQQEGLISIRPTAAADRRLTMTARQQTMVAWTTAAVMPLLVFVAGIYAWWRRR
jgi:ABC-type uncharacterized transport system involved in gliding motility auxiliary subunit